jgi:FtsP/CotA-like multicopper oxidase with cupredoxin domain
VTARLIDAELLAGALSTAAWLGAGWSAAARRRRLATALVTLAVLALVGRIGLVLALSRAGWWFVQEKVTVAVPLALIGVAAVALTIRRGPEPSARKVVALFVAGYTAAAGPLLGLFVGYPATWGAGLILLGAVAVAAGLTWRAVAPPVRPRPVGWLLAAAPLILGTAVAVTPPASAEPGTLNAIPVSAVRGPNPATAEAAGVPVRRFTLTARIAEVTLSSGRRVRAWTFDGQVPGPAIRVTQGDLVEVTVRNLDITDGVTLHWHGYDVPVGEDGVAGMTQDAVLPGREFVYRFLADTAGTYWYHTHEVSDPGVRLGLYGMFVVLPRPGVAGLDLTLPLHTFGSTFAVGDRDEPTTHSVAPGTAVRLRVVNTDSAPHRLMLDGTPFRVAAVDGTDLNEPAEVRRVAVRLAAGGRADLALVMGPEPVTLRIDDHAAAVRLIPPGTATSAVTGDGDTWPTLDLTRYGMPGAVPFDARSRFDRHHTMVLDRGLSLVDRSPTFAFTVNGRGFPHVTVQRVRTGDLVHLTVVNRSRDTHPIHVHGHHVLALTYNGRQFLGSPLWMDTFDVQPGEVWEVALRADNPGVWMNHCHNLRHAAGGMAVHLAYDGYTAPNHHAHSA